MEQFYIVSQPPPSLPEDTDDDYTYSTVQEAQNDIMTTFESSLNTRLQTVRSLDKLAQRADILHKTQGRYKSVYTVCLRKYLLCLFINEVTLVYINIITVLVDIVTFRFTLFNDLFIISRIIIRTHFCTIENNARLFV